MENLAVLFEGGAESKFIGLLLCLAEDHCPTTSTTVHLNYRLHETVYWHSCCRVSFGVLGGGMGKSVFPGDVHVNEYKSSGKLSCSIYVSNCFQGDIPQISLDVSASQKKKKKKSV